MSVLVLLFILATGAAALARPWIGVIAAYLIAILDPKSIWWWAFEDIRPVYMIVLPTFVGAILAGLRGKLEFGAIANRRIAMLALIALACTVSAAFGPYVVFDPSLGMRDSGFVYGNQLKILLMVLVAGLCVVEFKAIRWSTWMLVFAAGYLVYWANDQYLSGNFLRRLPGPNPPHGGGVYADENNFAALFVATFPFFWFMGGCVRNAIVRYGLWCLVPFAWHAVFLTASRGGLLGVGVGLLLIAVRSQRRWLGLLLIPAFAIAYVDQAGDTMKERAATIDDYREEASANARLNLWQGALRMIEDRPVTGVGPASFLRAFPSYSDWPPQQAHSTYLQMAAEYGLLAGVALVAALIFTIAGLFRASRRMRALPEDAERSWIMAMIESTLCGLVALSVCAVFLTLPLFEVLYFLLFLGNSLIWLVEKRTVDLRRAATRADNVAQVPT